MRIIDEKKQQQVFEKLEKLTMTDAKKYMRLQEAKTVFSIGESKIRKIAEEAGAIRKVDKMVLYNVSVLYDYIEKTYS